MAAIVSPLEPRLPLPLLFSVTFSAYLIYDAATCSSSSSSSSASSFDFIYILMILILYFFIWRDASAMPPLMIIISF